MLHGSIYGLMYALIISAFEVWCMAGNLGPIPRALWISAHQARHLFFAHPSLNAWDMAAPSVPETNLHVFKPIQESGTRTSPQDSRPLRIHRRARREVHQRAVGYECRLRTDIV